MSQLRKLLFPVSILYKSITSSRNVLYDKGILKSHEFDIPLIVVGNLRVGGTGKTPMVAYLVKLLKKNYKIAVLSRGYKRKTLGFVLANEMATAENIGDEPYQLYRQHQDVLVAVDADRVNGIETLMQLEEKPELILLDDAFQHRKVKADFNILLTPYDDLYVDDALLPSGNLRETVSGAKRAQIIVVTKCPENLTEKEQFETTQKLKPTLNQTVFFSKIQYSEQIVGKKNTITLSELTDYEVLLLTGIANPKPLVEFLKGKNIHFTHLEYPDHHAFSTSEIAQIQQSFNDLDSNKKLILTTEKDYVRIFALFADLYYLAIETNFVSHQRDFDKMIFNYVEQSTRNRSISER